MIYGEWSEETATQSLADEILRLAIFKISIKLDVSPHDVVNAVEDAGNDNNSETSDEVKKIILNAIDILFVDKKC